VLSTTIALRKANDKANHKITLLLNSLMVFKLKSKIIKKPKANVVTKKNLIGLTESISVYGAIAMIEIAAVTGPINLNWFLVLPNLSFTIYQPFQN
jgi:uncharacterized membrane protein (DUF2068 family)